MKSTLRFVLGVILLLMVLAGAVGAYGVWGVDGAPSPVNPQWTKINQDEGTSLLERGAYLVKQANCMGCHTTTNGAAFAGGRVLKSEFGDFVTPNITSSKRSGLGSWTADEFWQALHNGKGKGGRLLYPAFPFENYTHITRADADAMFAYLQSVPADERENEAHRLRFPYDQRVLLAWWRAVYFRPSELSYQVEQSPIWNRGAYLVRGLGHCSACHGPRDALGGGKGSGDWSGATMPGSQWYAPSLVDAQDSSFAQLPMDESLALLRHGQNSYRGMLGPMAEVVKASLQEWRESDITATIVYLQDQAKREAKRARPAPDFLDRSLQQTQVTEQELQFLVERGAKLYQKHCAECHGDDGQGRAGVYPRLQGSVMVQRANSANLVRIILAGGFSPSTKQHPRPYGMPPFSPFLDDDEVALLASYVRNAWGNKAGVVSSSDVNPYRTISLD